MEITFINRLRSGHLCTNEYLNLIKAKNSPECECRQDIQDVNHIFFSCVLTRIESEDLCKFLKDEAKLPPPYDIRNITFSNEEKILKRITKFAIDIKDTVNLIHTTADED